MGGERMTGHYVQRFRERVDPHGDPAFVWRGIVWAVENQRSDLVQYLGRTFDKCRKFKFRYAKDGNEYVIVTASDISRAVTVMAHHD
jgi:hypothetical protein